MPNERDFVLHSWCVPGDWNAPTVVGGRGAKLILEDGPEMLDMSSLVACSSPPGAASRAAQTVAD
jgi:taurine--2-oxoglutarate transaminase